MSEKSSPPESSSSALGLGAKQKKTASLGRGLDSLLGEKILAEVSLVERKSKEESKNVTSAPEELRHPVALELSLIHPNPKQPRKIFKNTELEELAQSLKDNGIIQPVVVTKALDAKHYLIVAGERRWRAAKLAGLEKIPVVVKDVKNEDLLQLALVENIQRSELNPIEEAEAYASLIEDCHLTQEDLSLKVGKDRSTIANVLRLLLLPKEVQNDIVEEKLTMGHARALLSLSRKELILRAREIVVQKELSVRQTEKLCRTLLDTKINDIGGMALDASEEGNLNPNLTYVVDLLRAHLKTKVKLSGDPERGKLEISYFSTSELERIITLLGIKIS